MGGTFSTFTSLLWKPREYRILVIGLDGAGKTTILHRLITGETTSTIPTIGFNVETVIIKNIKIQVWDLGGQSSIRPYWRCYYTDTSGIVFVVDSADTDRISTAKEELSAMLNEDELKGAPLLILANKQDLPGSLSSPELSDALEVARIMDRPWHLQTTTAIKGEGVEEGFDWNRANFMLRTTQTPSPSLTSRIAQDDSTPNANDQIHGRTFGGGGDMRSIEIGKRLSPSSHNSNMNVYDVKSLDRRLKSNSIQIIDQSNHDSRFSVGASLDQSQCDHGSPLISKKLNSNTGLDFLRAETFGSSHRRRIIESPPHNALSIKQVPSNLPSLYADVPNYEVDDDPISSSLHSRSIDKKCFKRHSKRLRPRLAPEEEDRTFDFCSQSASVSSQKSSISHLRLSDVPSIDENNLDDKFSHIGNKYQVKKYDLRKRGQKIYDFHRLHRSTPKKKYFNRKYSLLEPRKRGRPPKLKNLRKSPRNLQQVSYNERDTTGTDFFEDCMVDEGSESEQKSLVHRGSFNRKSNRIPESCKNFSTSEDEDDHSLELVKQLNLYDHQLNEEDSKVSIADRIAGMEDYLRQLKEMVLFPLLYPEMYNNFGMKPPRGVIFYGPPGTGKTMLARLLAESCSTGSKKVSFFIRNGSECLSKWIGEAEKNLRALFKQASEQQPSIIFFDEIDGLAPERSARQEQSHVSLVATLLALMDGLHDRGNVVVIGATNRIDSIDRALRRPGRFDREFAFTLPSETIRRRILDIYTTKWNPLPDSLLLDILASDTEGFSGADLRALCSEAALNGIRRTCPSMYDPIAPPPPTETVIQAISQIKINESDFRRALKAVLPLEIKMKASNVKYRDLDSFIYENSIENTANLILKLAGISSNEDENLDENIKNFHNIKNVPTEQVTDDCVAAQSGVLCLNFKGKSTASLSHMEGLCLAASKRLESFTQGEIIIIDPIKQILVSKQSEENFYSYLTEIVSSKRRKNQKLRVIFWPGLSALLQSESQNAVPALYITFIKAWIERNFSSGLQDISCILVSIEGFGESVVCLRDLANAAGLRVSSAELRLSWSLDGIFKWVQKIISSNISLQIIGSIEEHEKITTSMGKLWSTIESQKTFDDVDQIMKNIKRHVELVAAQYLPPTETQSEPPFDICQVIDKFMHDYPSSID